MPCIDDVCTATGVRQRRHHAKTYRLVVSSVKRATLSEDGIGKKYLKF